MNGFLLALKPPGMTSTDVVSLVKWKLPKGTKIGHAGTLDPEAAGVLPLMIGRATRLFDYIADKEKAYLVEVIPGIETDTQDYTGNVLCKGPQFDMTALETAFPSFLGTIHQVPPMYSAIKKDGQRLYDLARSGKIIEREAREVSIFDLEPCFSENGHLFISVRCGRGTYMRTLCHDMGEYLQSKACMGMLIRTESGPFSIRDCRTIEEIAQLERSEEIENILLPMDKPLERIPRIDVHDWDKRRIRSGTPIPVDHISGFLETGKKHRLYFEDEFCGIVHLSSENTRENEVRFDCMLLE